MTTTLPPLHTLRSQQSTTSLSHRGSNSADSTIVDAVRKEMTIASTHTSMFSITEHDSWNQFRDPKLEESFLMYHNARNKRSVLRVVTFVFVFILIENTLDFIKIGWEEHKVPGMLSLIANCGIMVFSWIGQTAPLGPRMRQIVTAFAVYFYYLVANGLLIVFDSNPFTPCSPRFPVKQSMMVAFLVAPMLYMSAGCTWSILVTACGIALSSGDEWAFLDHGVGWIMVLLLFNGTFTFAIKHIDKLYREEFLMHRNMKIVNQKLIKRLNALELMKQGKLDVDEEIKEYLNMNFSTSTGSQNERKKSSRLMGSTLLPSMVPTHTTPQPRQTQPGTVVESTVKYLPRCTTFEQYFHKYAPNTLVTMTTRDPSPYGHRACMSLKSEMSYAIPVVDEAVTKTDFVKSDILVKVESQYESNITKEYPNIDIFSGSFGEFIARFAEGTALTQVVLIIMERLNLLESLTIDRQKLTTFLLTIESGYSTDAPYHNAMHACDVVISMAYFLRSSSFLLDSVTDVESMCRVMPCYVLEFACIIAAACHDFQHLACNNNFLIKIGHDLSLIYNDQSVLENHHASAALRICSLTGCDFLNSVAPDDCVSIREIVINLILATDMKSHFRIVKEFTQLLDGTSVDMKKQDDKMLVLRVMIKLCDICHVLKPKADTVEWTRRINEEFFLQGDAEAARGLPVSPFMDRKTTSIPKSQVGFLQFVVKPLVQSWCEFMHDDTLTVRLTDITAYWDRLHKNNVRDAAYV